MDSRKVLAEVVGTFTFFLIGLMAVLATVGWPTGPDLVVIAFGFGLGLFAAIQIAGSISGGHFNPAVTVAAVLDGRLDVRNGVAYIVGQVVGGIGAAGLVLLMTSQAAVAKTVTKPGSGLSDIQALVVEIVFTAIFIAVILTVTKKAPTHAAFAIPLTLVVIHLAIVPFTGASVNPARSLASAVIGGDLAAIWIYIVGPIVGAVAGWGVYRGLAGTSSSSS